VALKEVLVLVVAPILTYVAQCESIPGFMECSVDQMPHNWFSEKVSLYNDYFYLIKLIKYEIYFAN
jgi:hypothetical protein